MEQEIKDRFNAITDIQAVFNHFKMNVNNKGILLKQIIDDEDITKLEDLEQKWQEVKALQEREEFKQTLIEAGKLEEEKCKDVLRLFTGHLKNLNITQEDSDSLETATEAIFTALSKIQVGKAITLITTLETSTIITEEIKEDALSILNK